MKIELCIKSRWRNQCGLYDDDDERIVCKERWRNQCGFLNWKLWEWVIKKKKMMKEFDEETWGAELRRGDEDNDDERVVCKGVDEEVSVDSWSEEIEDAGWRRRRRRWRWKQ
jgi:hypothetical protein